MVEHTGFEPVSVCLWVDKMPDFTDFSRTLRVSCFSVVDKF